jgi:hypothetical protein
VNLCHNVEVGKGILGFERASDVNFVIAWESRAKFQKEGFDLLISSIDSYDGFIFL